jgi:hypothetical protein
MACDKQRLISWACPVSSAGNSVELHGAEFKGGALTVPVVTCKLIYSLNSLNIEQFSFRRLAGSRYMEVNSIFTKNREITQETALNFLCRSCLVSIEGVPVGSNPDRGTRLIFLETVYAGSRAQPASLGSFSG